VARRQRREGQGESMLKAHGTEPTFQVDAGPGAAACKISPCWST